MKKSLAAASALALITYAAQAQADSPRWPNWYLGISEGITYLPPTDLKNTGAFDRTSYEKGSGTYVSLGYMPGMSMWPFDDLRIEAEGGYHYNELKNIDGVSASGALRMWTYMGNLYYDFRNGSQWTPYIGGGVGDANIRLSHSGGVTNTSDNTLAYQAMAGITYAPTTMPMTEWNIGYRYFDAVNPDFGSGATEFKSSDIRSNSAEVGAKFRF